MPLTGSTSYNNNFWLALVAKVNLVILFKDPTYIWIKIDLIITQFFFQTSM